ncbi:MAG: hypothetical protein EA401_06125 [Planctomycetota bacterium]|nr:MAG: hypothetical protein EA401_06125 [Planctomycetota bacterium]
MVLLNTQTIDELQDAIGQDAVHDIAQALQQTLDTFRAERAHMTPEEMGRHAHSLKGSTSYLGTEDLHAAALTADTAHKEGGDTAAALDHLISLIDPSMEALNAYLKI